MKRHLLWLFAFCTVGVSAKEELGANDLLHGCEGVLLLADGKKLDAEEMVRASRASAYVDGYIDAVLMVHRVRREDPPEALRQDRPLLDHIRDIATFIRENPEIRREASARVAILLSLQRKP
ncbi:MAG TPA: hypothetical protein VHF69_00145 [Candidatus Synoicihabitans sp.]|nr:hypothetical protein [Candidatus Synoicihabitans sp.]